jgi:hypothetical protein
MSDEIQILDQTGRWRARNVKYWRGRWEQLKSQIPTFKIEDFRVAGDTPSNPYLKTVVRQPLTLFEMPVPVGVVSNTYSLAQHTEVAAKCLQGIETIGVSVNDLECEVGLTELGEWMNLRIYFPDRFTFTPSDGNPIRLRLECTNSVDGSSRLIVMLSWLRVICSNGWVIGESKTEIRDIHNEYLNLDKINDVVSNAMTVVENDVRRLSGWEDALISSKTLENWVNEILAKKWGKKAACRVFHICDSGHDVEIVDPFASGEATEKPIKKIKRVPGAPEKAVNLYDISQAMSWVATSRNNSEERLEWQSCIPEIIGKFATL